MSARYLLLLAACSGPQARPEPACNADADIVLRGQDDVWNAKGCLTIQSLTIRSGHELDLTPLKKLHVVLGDVRVGPTVGFIDLSLPELHSVGSLQVIGNGNLHGVMFPKLVTAQEITIGENIELTTISMPRLAKVRGDFTIANASSLGLVELSSLATVGGAFVVRAVPKLTLLEVGKLESASAITIEDTALADESVEQLRGKAKPAP